MFSDALDRILHDHCTPSTVRAIEAGSNPLPLWERVRDAGFLELMETEARGGAGFTLPELFPIMVNFGRYAAPLPWSETLLSRLLLQGHDIPTGMITLSPGLQRRADGTLCCARTPYGAIADAVIAREGDDAWLLSTHSAHRVSIDGPCNQTATLVWADHDAALKIPSAGAKVAACGAALYAAQLAGAMMRVMDMTLQYCNDRKQFGRSLGKFQAVQHQASVMAEHVAAAMMAAEAAFQTPHGEPDAYRAAVAKSRASEAAGRVASTAHALHGAMGVTEEYDLALWTRCLHAWRMAHGSELLWNALIGRAVLGGTDSLSHFVQLHFN